ncbi:MAG: type III restriction endonuclease subunit R, partial [Bacteroidota bacterium]
LPRIGRAVQEALTEAGLIRTSPNDLRVVVEETSTGIWSSTLRGATFHEQSLYADALADVLAPIDNPRYLITRPGRALWKRRTDYHAVPSVLATHRSLASTFQQAWRKHVGHGELSYTRSRDGRRRLLAARGRALSSEFTDAVTRRDRWS